MLTGIKDVDLLILDFLNDETLLKINEVNKYFYYLTKYEYFWENKFIRKYGNYGKPMRISWRDIYLKAFWYMDIKCHYGYDYDYGLISASKIGDIDLIDFFIWMGERHLIPPHLKLQEKDMKM